MLKRVSVRTAFAGCLSVWLCFGYVLYHIGMRFQHDSHQYDLGEKLLSAAIVGDNHAIQNLVQQGANLEFSDNCTALEAAVQNGYPETVNLLVRLGAKVDSGGDGLGTPLVECTDAGIAECLLDHGARVNARDQSSMTPLMHAAREGNAEVVRLLIQRGADLNTQSYDHKTALNLALEEARSNEAEYHQTVKVLRDAGAVTAPT